MADNDDYEIQYYKYLEKIGMTPPNIKVIQTPQKQNNSAISQKLLFQNSSLKKELNYQRINSIIVLNNQLEINLTNKQNQSKILNITSNQEAKSPIFDIQTSLLQPHEQKNEKGLSQIDEFADEYQQETSNKTNCFDSNIRQEQNNNNINLDFSSIQLNPQITNKYHEESQQRSQLDNQQFKQDQDMDNQTSLQNNQDLNIQNNQYDTNIAENNQESSKQNSPIKTINDQNKNEQFEQLQLQQQIIKQNELIDISGQEINNQNCEPESQIEMNPKIIVQEQQQNEISNEPETSNQLIRNVDINEQELSDISLEKVNKEIIQSQFEVSDNNQINIDKMEIESVSKPEMIIQEQLILKSETNNQECNHIENKQCSDQQLCTININLQQQQTIEQRLVEKKKQKQRKSRIINKKKKKERKNQVNQNEQQQNNEKQQFHEIKDCENNQISKIDQKPNNNIPIIIEQEQKNPVCNLLQSLIQGFYGENIKINWNKYIFLKKKIQKKRSILLKSKLLM